MTADRTNSGLSGERLAVANAVGSALADSVHLSDAAAKILEVVCEHLGWDVGVLSLVDSATNALHRVGTWQRAGVGAGQAAEVPNASTAPLAGFFGTIGFPIRTGNDVLGTIELYSREAKRPDDDMLAVLESVGGQIADFIHRKDSEEEPGETGEKYRALVEGLPVVTYMAVADEGMRSLYVSPQIKGLIGVTAAEWRDDPTLRAKHLHAQDRDRVLAEYRRARETGKPIHIEYRMTARDSSTVWIREQAVASHDAGGRPTVFQGVLENVTDQRQGEHRAAYSAYHDELTGLPNREMFEEMLGQVLERAARHNLAVAALVLDLDDFNQVNSSLGPDAGDELLRQVAARLRDSAEEADLVARQGGDEFLLLLSGRQRGDGGSLRSSAEGALLVAEAEASRIQEALQAPFVLADMEFYVTASIGISIYPLDAQDGAEMLAHAANAMRRSKKSGPGGFVLYSMEAEDPVRGLSFTMRLRKAVERHDWVLHYHPIMHLADRQMVGVEALLRWQDSDGNLVPPGEFIMAAEDMGLIEAVGDWVLEEVCRQSRAWRDEGLELDTSINLSPRQLWQPNLVQRIVSHLDSTGVDPETVVIEITESAATADPDRTLRVLREFRDRGLRLAIDDFGTAASSINRLKDLPVDILKVDQSFVRRLPADRDAARMARAIVGLGHSLGMVPLAEGIDSEDQREFLVRSGCPLGQGYLFGKPMPADAITALCLADEPPSPAGSGEEHQREPRMPVDPPARTAPSPPAVRMPPMTPTAQEPPAKRSAPDLQVLPGEPPPRDDEPAAPDNPSFYPRPSPEPDLDAIFGRDPSEEPPAEPGDTRAERRGKASGSGG